QSVGDVFPIDGDLRPRPDERGQVGRLLGRALVQLQEAIEQVFPVRLPGFFLILVLVSEQSAQGAIGDAQVFIFEAAHQFLPGGGQLEVVEEVDGDKSALDIGVAQQLGGGLDGGDGVVER